MWRSKVLGGGLTLGLALASAGGCMSVSTSSASAIHKLEDAIVYHPARYPEGDWQPEGFRFQDAWFSAADGVRLHGWYCEAAQPRAVVLFAHGNAGNVSTYYWKLRYLCEKQNVTVLAFDYRGYGKSEGSPSEEGILADARAARRWLAQRAGIREQDIVLMGHSLGGGVAVDLAARDGARGLILENTFSSVPDVAAARIKLVDVRGLMATRLNSHTLIRFYQGPLLQTHGDADRLIPITLGKKLFDAANEPKQFIAVHGGHHTETSAPEYLAALDQFFELLGRHGR